MNAIIYNRKSRGTEEELQKNKTEMIDYCTKNDFTYRYLEEIGSSVDDERKGYIELISYVKTGQYDAIVIMELSRLTRNLKQQLELFEILTENQVVIHAVLDNDIIDPSNQMNEMMSIFKGTFNQLAYKETAKKMHLGRLQSARQGKWLNSTPYGYRKNPETLKLEIVEEEAAVVRKMFDMVIEGFSLTQIYRKVYQEGIRTRNGKVFHDRTISMMFDYRAYLGEVNFKSNKFDEEVYVKNAHPAIISYEDFYKVREILDKRKRFNERISKVLSPVDKLVYCKYCKRKMQITRGSSVKTKRYTNINKCRHYVEGEPCPNKGSALSLVLPSIYTEIEKHIPVIQNKLSELYTGGVDGSSEKLRSEKKVLDKNLQSTIKQKERLLDLLLNETINELAFKEKDTDLATQIKAIEQRLSDIEEILIQRSVSNDTERIEKMLEQLTDLQNKPTDEQNRILLNIIERIEYFRTEDELEIDIFFKE
ncbi:recombinase family protein [Sporosarcina koreensis]|uniref:recombinase family protein n=1 Tax=Sporosarcina koreensis TaxID=334735 RepID=UPI00058CE09D|nr:recombinase family protein [Sporosarcina koreensis]